MTSNVTGRIKAGLIAFTLLLAQVVLPVQSAYAASNNGTLKVHEKNALPNTESNNPKVCVFNFEGFGLDAGQTGDITIETQSGTPEITPVVVSLTTDANGAGETEYINDTDSSITLADGHYKATLDNKFGTDAGNKAKSKVFKVTCDSELINVTPLAPSPNDICETEDDTYTIPGIVGVDYLVDGEIVAAGTYTTNGQLSVTITAEARDGYVLSGTQTWTFSYTDVDCEVADIPVTPAPVTKSDICELENDKYTITATTGVDYLVDGQIVAAGEYTTGGESSITVTAQAQDGYVLTGVAQWTLTFTNQQCEEPNVCTAEDNFYIQPWTHRGTQFPAAGGSATFEFKADGLHLSTPLENSYVYGLMDAGETPLSDVDAMSYKTMRQTTSMGASNVLPAYIVLIDKDGNMATPADRTYFLYEPLYNGTVQTGVWQTWDVLNGGNSKWWGDGNSNPDRTWNQIMAQYPDAIAVSYGFNQGTSNKMTNTVIQDIQFDDCATTVFGVPGSGGGGEEEEEEPTPETPTTPTVPVTPVVPTPVSPAGGSGALLPAELPMTGQNGSIVSTWMALLAALLTYGAVYYLQPKKRFER
ncbi:MAG: hypothetical protein V4678_03355 [Patescibacteria group bacterium]